MEMNTKASIVKFKWAEVMTHINTLTDEELLQRVTEYERAHVEAQTALEAAKHEIDRRRNDVKSRMYAIQTEEDRKYRPKPQDKIEFDKKAREDKIKVSKEDKAIEKLMSLGFDRETAEKMFNEAKAGDKK